MKKFSSEEEELDPGLRRGDRERKMLLPVREYVTELMNQST